MEITTRKIGRYTDVLIDGHTVAIMERSPFSGEFCYGLKIEGPQGVSFRPPFTPTRRKSVKAAAKVVAAAIA